jgi:toxin ParE1/3/4
MNYQLIVRQTAEQQAREAYWWYEEKLEGLGDEFLLSLDACINLIERNPNLFQKKYKNVRMGMIQRFPYGVYYIINENSIIVLAILHFGRSTKTVSKI